MMKVQPQQFQGKKILILGSGGLRIGQAGEFDYSGSQAIKALKEEGIRTVLINPNIATVQTDPGMADQVYLHPLNVETVEHVIAKERPAGVFISFGGQTALNLGLELDRLGILEKYQLPVLGSSLDTVRISEDRKLFKAALKEIRIKTAKSLAVHTVEDALHAAEKIGYPIMLRAGFSLGGLGSGKIHNPDQLRQKAREALHGAPQILIEEFLGRWKEVEYEIMRDQYDQAITVCNMENMDPMGIHTGESIVVAPSQTLTNNEYHRLREIALKVARHLGIVGECNIQYALNPYNGDYRVIEVNARLSRSSALASKATGYPLAFVAAKCAIGYRLCDIKNSVTKETCAFFEPALDYIVVKIPRWDTQKLKAADSTIGSEMKSVGEVMGIGRSFPEALQKAVRMLNIGATGLHDAYSIDSPEKDIARATNRRLFALYHYLKETGNVEQAEEMSHICPWFLHHIHALTRCEKELCAEALTPERLLYAKRMGFSDASIAKWKGMREERLREKRLEWNIIPYVKQIDTLAGEFAAHTNYLYTTYHASEHDLAPSENPATLILGSGPYCIGSSVEFDWCAVNTARTLKELKEPSLLINCNPETVSTDYDESDRLYFEELSLERVRDILDFEQCKGTIVSVGGQIANNLALALHKKGYPILGTPASSIDRAENRETFSSMLNELEIDQPPWQRVSSLEGAKAFAEEMGYPVIVRPSYVLSGAAMNVVHSPEDLEKYVNEATTLSPDFPTVISKFLEQAKELEVDGVAHEGKVVIDAVSEHVENAGVHSGDATLVLPPQRLYLETIRRAKKMTRAIVKALRISGPFNIQFLAKENTLKVIECNVRASRSFPFVSKVTGHNFIAIATRLLFGRYQPQSYETLELDYVGIKSPQFSYQRLKGANPVAHVEMASTGEVACIGDTYQEAFFTSWLSTDQSMPKSRLLISVGGPQKAKILEPLRLLEEKGWELYATEGTHKYFAQYGVGSVCLYKMSDAAEPNVRSALINRDVDLIICIPNKQYSDFTSSDGYKLRRLAIDYHIPLITNFQIAQLFLLCLIRHQKKHPTLKSLQEYTQAEL